MFNGILDIYHKNSFAIREVMNNNVTVVIHKATEDTTFQDEKYHERRREAKASM